MEVDGIQTCKFSRVANGSKLDSSKLIHHHLYPHDDHSHHHTSANTITKPTTTPGNHINGLAAPEMGSALPPGGAPDDGGGNGNRFRHWQHSNRIIRVSRASGGKDRHSKVWTAKGPRDRRVRLSVNTAIQFYDLQDRLGFDQPSKAVEWLIKAASDAIAELPSLNTPFTTTVLDDHPPPAPSASAYDAAPLSGGGGVMDHSDEDDDEDNDGAQPPEPDGNNFAPHHQGSLGSKSACSSTSETSKGSGGLSLSRSRTEIRVKARERARERAAKDKDNPEPLTRVVSNNVNHHMSHGGSSSFTQLLTAGIGVGNVDTSSTTTAVPSSSPSVVAAAIHGNNGRHWPITTSSAPMAMDYFSMLAMASSSSSSSSRGPGSGGTANDNNNNTSSNNNNGNPHNHSSSGFSGQIQLGNSMSQTMMVSPFTIAAGDHHHHSDLHHFPFVPDHLVQQNTAAAAPGNDYNLNFSISPSGLAGFNRGTLQSNSPPSSMYPHLQRFSTLDGTSLPFFLGAAAAAAAVSSAESQQHHHHHQQFPPGLHLCYGDGGRQQSDQKGKGKN